jgi:hypothetical protein
MRWWDRDESMACRSWGLGVSDWQQDVEDGDSHGLHRPGKLTRSPIICQEFILCSAAMNFPYIIFLICCIPCVFDNGGRAITTNVCYGEEDSSWLGLLICCWTWDSLPSKLVSPHSGVQGTTTQTNSWTFHWCAWTLYNTVGMLIIFYIKHN